MKTIELKEMTLENIGVWPIQGKIFVIVLCCVIIMGIGYYLDIQAQFTQLSIATQKEVTLRKDFEFKQQLAVNLLTYKKQLQEIQSSFAAMLRKLPGKTEVPALLEDISKTGIANGLEFLLFKPLPEKQMDFYTELPIQISVIGHYHQLAHFISQVAALDRIVSLHDFFIRKPEAVAGDKNPNANLDDDKLQMDLLAKTYRYLDEKEIRKDKQSDNSKK